MVTFRPPCARPLHPIGAGAIPPGEFRVTRSFNDLSFPQHGPHDGLDIGNGRIHDPILAMAPGTVTEAGFRADAGGAAIVRIDHGDGWSSGYAHMDRIDVVRGQRVSEGAQIGILGSTGWVSGAHLHFDITRNGVRLDPWPLLKLEDDVKIKGKFLRHVQNRRTGLTTNSNFRAGVLEGDDDPIGVLAAGTTLYPVVTVAGREVGTAADRAEWHGALAYVANAYHFGYVHSSVCAPFEPIQAADCTALENKLDGIATAANGLVQAGQAIVGLAQR